MTQAARTRTQAQIIAAVPDPLPVPPGTSSAPPPATERVDEGWRKGRPIEDPEKTKRWGYVSAKPSEYLIHMRDGRVLPKSSGQGATCFKRPRDAIAIVPTSLQRLRFTADQVTLERVGVATSGLAVFRIADPLLAFRVLNFSYPERAQEKLRETIGDMLIGATRRLVANLTVNDCLQKRKLALADELFQELAPVVGGTGRFDDETDRGWGVVLDTIEIQEVRILSKKLFVDMQAPFRTELSRNAERARAAAEKESRLRGARDREEIEQAELNRERLTTRTQSEVEGEKSQRAKALALLRVQNQAEVDEKQTAAKSAAAQRRAELERATQQRQARHAFEMAQGELEAEKQIAQTRMAQETEALLLEVQRDADIELERTRREALAEQERANEKQARALRVAAENLAQIKRDAEQDRIWLEAQSARVEEQRAREALTLLRTDAELERERRKQALAHEQRMLDLEAAKKRAHIMRIESSARVQLLMAEKLPELAGAVGQKFGEIKLTQFGGSDGLSVAPAIDAVSRLLTLAKGAVGDILDTPAPPADDE